MPYYIDKHAQLFVLLNRLLTMTGFFLLISITYKATRYNIGFMTNLCLSSCTSTVWTRSATANESFRQLTACLCPSKHSNFIWKHRGRPHQVIFLIGCLPTVVGFFCLDRSGRPHELHFSLHNNDIVEFSRRCLDWLRAQFRAKDAFTVCYELLVVESSIDLGDQVDLLGDDPLIELVIFNHSFGARSFGFRVSFCGRLFIVREGVNVSVGPPYGLRLLFLYRIRQIFNPFGMKLWTNSQSVFLIYIKHVCSIDSDILLIRCFLGYLVWILTH